MCNLRGKGFVVHEEKVNFPDVADQELLQAIGEKVAGLDEASMNIQSMLGNRESLTFLLLP